MMKSSGDQTPPATPSTIIEANTLLTISARNSQALESAIWTTPLILTRAFRTISHEDSFLNNPIFNTMMTTEKMWMTSTQ